MPSKTTDSPGLVDQLSQYFRDAFPTINAVRTNTTGAINRAVASGDYARAAGASLVGVPEGLAAGVTDVVGRPALGVARGIGSFLGGALGSSGSTTDALPTPVAAKPVPVAVATNPVANAMAQGREAAVPANAADEIHNFIASRIKSGVTNHDLAALSGIAQAVPALTKVQQTNRDKITGTAGAVTDAEFAADLAAAKKLGADSPEYTAAVQKATDKYRQNLATLIGVNPQGLSMQAMLADQQAGGQ
jgi:hypothetical protein